LAAAEAAKALGVKVYTIGAGIRGDAPVPVKDQFGNTKIVMAKVDVDEDTLQKIANATGAKFFRATDTDSLKQIYSDINALEKTTQTVRKFERHQDIFAWLLFPALLTLGLSVGLELTRYRRLP
jgi:Ca-activated chloride channel family protein